MGNIIHEIKSKLQHKMFIAYISPDQRLTGLGSMKTSEVVSLASQLQAFPQNTSARLQHEQWNGLIADIFG